MTDVANDVATLLNQIDEAVSRGDLVATAAENLRIWLTEPRYSEYAAEVAEHIEEGKWKALDDVFWTVIPFGTGGRRGKMYPIGSNAINDRTIGESAQGLAEYVKENQTPGTELACAIGYDTRHRSRHFAELCAEIMAAAGFTVYFLDGHRSTPELSATILLKNCACGIMVSASHNPPCDNAVKAYWSTSSQLLPPHDQGVIDRVVAVSTLVRMDFEKALSEGRVVYCQDEADRAYIDAVVGQALPGPRELKIIYSPLHGVGATSVCPVLEADGFSDVEVFALHAAPDGDFPNVPEHVSNPENPATFDAIISRAVETGADLIMSTDPDADRLGCAAPVTAGGQFKTINGNQLAALLTDYVLQQRQAAGSIGADHYVIKTLVTTELMRRIADSYGVKTYGNIHVGFKWIGQLIDEVGPEQFVFGAEESHGYLAGSHCRDKDAAVAALLLAELAARTKADGKTLHEKLDELYLKHGCHAEKMISTKMPGSGGMARMQELMADIRRNPPKSLAGIEVRAMRDYLNGVIRTPGGDEQPLDAPRGNLVIIDWQRAQGVRRTSPLDDAPDIADPGEGAEAGMLARESTRALLDCLESLEQQQRDAIRTAFFDGVTYAELAVRRAVPLGTMKSWVRRGLARLKDCLDG